MHASQNRLGGVQTKKYFQTGAHAQCAGPVSTFVSVWYLCIIVGVCVFPKTIDFENLPFNTLELLWMDKSVIFYNMLD